MKYFFVIMVAIVFSMNTVAQVNMNIGFGLNVSDVNYEQLEASFTTKTSPAYNYFLSIRPEIFLSEKFSLHTDIQYSRQGYKMGESSSDTEIRFHYLDIIPHLQYRIFNVMAVYAGCGMKYLLREDFKFGDTWTKYPFETNNKMVFTYLGGIRLYATEKITLHTHISSNRLNHIMYSDDQGNPFPFKERLFNLQIGAAYKIL